MLKLLSLLSSSQRITSLNSGKFWRATLQTWYKYLHNNHSIVLLRLSLSFLRLSIHCFNVSDLSISMIRVSTTAATIDLEKRATCGLLKQDRVGDKIPHECTWGAWWRKKRFQTFRRNCVPDPESASRCRPSPAEDGVR